MNCEPQAILTDFFGRNTNEGAGIKPEIAQDTRNTHLDERLMTHGKQRKYGKFRLI